MAAERVPDGVDVLQTCYFWYHGGEPDAELLSVTRPDQMLVVTCPESCPALIESFNRAGGLVLLYVSIYKAAIIADVPDDLRRWEGGSPFRSSLLMNPYWSRLDLAGHSDWMLRDEEGRPRRPFDVSYYMRGWYQVSPLIEGYRRAVCEAIGAVARDGRFSGIFLDNVHANTRPSTLLRDGKMAPADMKEHEAAFYRLIESMRGAGNRASREHFWIQTNGCAHQTVQSVADLMLFESFLYSWAWPEPPMDDETALGQLMSLGLLRERGGRPVVLPYLGFSGNDIVEDARRIRRLADRANALFADFYTLVRPETVAPSARRCLAGQRADEPSYYPGVREALKRQSAGNLAAAKEIYRL